MTERALTVLLNTAYGQPITIFLGVFLVVVLLPVVAVLAWRLKHRYSAAVVRLQRAADAVGVEAGGNGTPARRCHAVRDPPSSGPVFTKGGYMRRLAPAAVVLLALATAGPLAAEELKIKLQGTAVDTAKLLERLNENGKDAGLTFVEAESDYLYRIAIYAEGATGSDFVLGGGADASAAVLTPDCEVAFIITRGSRTTKGGAVNALSKEIVKKLKTQKR